MSRAWTLPSYTFDSPRSIETFRSHLRSPILDFPDCLRAGPFDTKINPN